MADKQRRKSSSRTPQSDALDETRRLLSDHSLAAMKVISHLATVCEAKETQMLLERVRQIGDESFGKLLQLLEAGAYSSAQEYAKGLTTLAQYSQEHGGRLFFELSPTRPASDVEKAQLLVAPPVLNHAGRGVQSMLRRKFEEVAVEFTSVESADELLYRLLCALCAVNGVNGVEEIAQPLLVGSGPAAARLSEGFRIRLAEKTARTLSNSVDRRENWLDIEMELRQKLGAVAPLDPNDKRVARLFLLRRMENSKRKAAILLQILEMIRGLSYAEVTQHAGQRQEKIKELIEETADVLLESLQRCSFNLRPAERLDVVGRLLSSADLFAQDCNLFSKLLGVLECLLVPPEPSVYDPAKHDRLLCSAADVSNDSAATKAEQLKLVTTRRRCCGGAGGGSVLSGAPSGVDQADHAPASAPSPFLDEAATFAAQHKVSLLDMDIFAAESLPHLGSADVKLRDALGQLLEKFIANGFHRQNTCDNAHSVCESLVGFCVSVFGLFDFLERRFPVLRQRSLQDCDGALLWACMKQIRNQVGRSSNTHIDECDNATSDGTGGSSVGAEDGLSEDGALSQVGALSNATGTTPRPLPHGRHSSSSRAHQAAAQWWHQPSSGAAGRGRTPSGARGRWVDTSAAASVNSTGGGGATSSGSNIYSSFNPPERSEQGEEEDYENEVTLLRPSAQYYSMVFDLSLDGGVETYSRFDKHGNGNYSPGGTADNFGGWRDGENIRLLVVQVLFSQLEDCLAEIADAWRAILGILNAAGAAPAAAAGAGRRQPSGEELLRDLGSKRAVLSELHAVLDKLWPLADNCLQNPGCLAQEQLVRSLCSCHLRQVIDRARDLRWGRGPDIADKLAAALASLRGSPAQPLLQQGAELLRDSISRFVVQSQPAAQQSGGGIMSSAQLSPFALRLEPVALDCLRRAADYHKPTKPGDRGWTVGEIFSCGFEIEGDFMASQVLESMWKNESAVIQACEALITMHKTQRNVVVMAKSATEVGPDAQSGGRPQPGRLEEMIEKFCRWYSYYYQQNLRPRSYNDHEAAASGYNGQWNSSWSGNGNAAYGSEKGTSTNSNSSKAGPSDTSLEAQHVCLLAAAALCEEQAARDVAEWKQHVNVLAQQEVGYTPEQMAQQIQAMVQRGAPAAEQQNFHREKAANDERVRKQVREREGGRLCEKMLDYYCGGANRSGRCMPWQRLLEHFPSVLENYSQGRECCEGITRLYLRFPAERRAELLLRASPGMGETLARTLEKAETAANKWSTHAWDHQHDYAKQSQYMYQISLLELRYAVFGFGPAQHSLEIKIPARTLPKSDLQTKSVRDVLSKHIAAVLWLFKEFPDNALVASAKFYHGPAASAGVDGTNPNAVSLSAQTEQLERLRSFKDVLKILLNAHKEDLRDEILKNGWKLHKHIEAIFALAAGNGGVL
eukprot:g7584.t1